MGNGKREKTRAKRAEAFEAEQAECASRLERMLNAVRVGDVFKAGTAYTSIGASLRYLEANDPKREE